MYRIAWVLCLAAISGSVPLSTARGGDPQAALNRRLQAQMLHGDNVGARETIAQMRPHPIPRMDSGLDTIDKIIEQLQEFNAGLQGYWEDANLVVSMELAQREMVRLWDENPPDLTSEFNEAISRLRWHVNGTATLLAQAKAQTIRKAADAAAAEEANRKAVEDARRHDAALKAEIQEDNRKAKAQQERTRARDNRRVAARLEQMTEQARAAGYKGLFPSGIARFLYQVKEGSASLKDGDGKVFWSEYSKRDAFLDRKFEGRQLVSGMILYQLSEISNGDLVEFTILVPNEESDGFLENQRLRGNCHVYRGSQTATTLIGLERHLPIFERVPPTVCLPPAPPAAAAPARAEQARTAAPSPHDDGVAPEQAFQPPASESRMKDPAPTKKARLRADPQAQPPVPKSRAQKSILPPSTAEKLDCNKRQERWRQQGQPEWLIRESLNAINCP